jgi:small GTP-binding protein
MDKTQVYKVILVGDGNVGKTSLVRRYCSGKFEESRVMTIGVDFQIKKLKLGSEEIKLSIWDMAGQEQFHFVREGFYPGGQAVAFIYDMTNIQSLKNLVSWYHEVHKILNNVPMLVIGNKLDLCNKLEPYGEMLAAKLGVDYIRTSAQDGTGVEEMFIKLASLAAKV